MRPCEGELAEIVSVGSRAKAQTDAEVAPKMNLIVVQWATLFIAQAITLPASQNSNCLFIAV